MKINRLVLSACSVTILAMGTTLTGTSRENSEQTRPDTSALTKVRISVSEDHVVVGLLGERVLSGVLQEISAPPFRVFVDFVNITPEVDSVTPIGRGGVERVRVALNNSNPPVTRVVVDLSQRSTYRMERDPITHEFQIIIGLVSSTNVATPKMPVQLGKRPAVTEAPLTMIEDYVRWFNQSTQEVERLLVKGQKLQLVQEPEALDQDSLDWQKMHHELSMVTPPQSLQVAHDLLGTTVDLGYAAMHEKKHLNVRPTDVSAARAGASLLLMRARALVEAQIIDTSDGDDDQR